MPADWYGIYFRGSSAAAGEAVDSSRIDHAIVRFGGTQSTGNIVTSLANVAITNSHVSHSASVGIDISQSDAVLQNSEVFANTSSGIRYSREGNGTFTDSKIYANGTHGINALWGSITDSIQKYLLIINRVLMQIHHRLWRLKITGGVLMMGRAVKGLEVVIVSSNVDISDLLLDDFKTQELVYYLNAGPNQHRGSLSTISHTG